MYTISFNKFQNALIYFRSQNCDQLTKNINIILDGRPFDWFVIEQPDEAKLTEIANTMQTNQALIIENKGPTGHATLDQHGTQFGGCYIILGRDSRNLPNNIRE